MRAAQRNCVIAGGAVPRCAGTQLEANFSVRPGQIEAVCSRPVNPPPKLMRPTSIERQVPDACLSFLAASEPSLRENGTFPTKKLLSERDSRTDAGYMTRRS